MNNEKINQLMNELRNGNYDILLNAMYTYNADAELIEYEETAQELAEDILKNYQGCKMHNRLDCQDIDEYIIMCEKLNLEEQIMLERYTNSTTQTEKIC